MSRNTVLLIKLAVFALITVVLATQVDLQMMRTTLKDVRLDLLAAAFLILVVQLAVAALRWMLVLRLGGLPARGFRYLAYFGAGNITNLSLPGGVAGDVFRAWLAAREGLTGESAAVTVILDRLVALTALGALVVACVLWQLGLDRSWEQPIRLVALATGLAILGGGALLPAMEPLLRKLAGRRWLSLPHTLSLSARKLLGQPSFGVGKLYFIAIAAHVALVLALICLAEAFSVSLGLGDAFVVFPMVLLVSSLPITPGGWGMREGAMVLALTPYGVAVEASIGVSVVYGLLALAACLPSALAYLAIRE